MARFAVSFQQDMVSRTLMSGADYLICDEISTMLDVIHAGADMECGLRGGKKKKYRAYCGDAQYASC